MKPGEYLTITWREFDANPHWKFLPLRRMLYLATGRAVGDDVKQIHSRNTKEGVLFHAV